MSWWKMLQELQNKQLKELSLRNKSLIIWMKNLRKMNLADNPFPWLMGNGKVNISSG